MKKLIAAFDGLKYAESTSNYAMKLAPAINAKVIGVFLEDFTYHSYNLAELSGKGALEDQREAELKRRDAETRESSMRRFRTALVSESVDFAIHRDRNIAIQELLHESMYADMLIIQNNETLTHYNEEVPTNFIANLLERTECPVLLVPPVYQNPEKVVFLYDGNASSVFAMKLYTYIMAGFDLPGDLLCVRKEKEEKGMPDSHLVKEWFKIHYPEGQHHMMHGNPSDMIEQYLKQQVKNTLVVLGAYQRGSISRMLHKSMADIIMRDLDMPLFIAHK